MSLQVNFTSMDYISERVEKMIKYENLTILDLRKIRERLLYCCDTKSDKNFQLEFVLGNLDLEELRLLQLQDVNSNHSFYVESAKEHFQKALLIEEELPDAIYNLFKIAILEEEYDRADLYLKQYEIMKPENSFYISFIYKLLNYFLKEKRESLMGNKGVRKEGMNEPIYHNYLLAQKEFDEKDYRKVVKHLNVCAHLGKRKDFDFDFSPLILLGQRIFELDRNQRKEILRSNYEAEKDLGNRMMIIWQLLELDATDIENYFLLIDTYIDLNAYTPIESYLEKIKKLPNWLENKETISWYEKLFQEKMLEDTYMGEIESVLNTGTHLEKKGEYKEAIKVYEQGYDCYHYPYFQLKIGQLYYLLGDYAYSISYAEAYLKEGNFSWQEATTLLYKSNRKLGKPKTAIHSSISYYQSSRMQKRGNSLEEWLISLNENYLSEEESPMGNKIYINTKKGN